MTPGVSTRDDAERVLGAPVRAISPTLTEYAGRQKILKFYIQYRPGSATMDRIEILFSNPESADQVFRDLGLQPGSSGPSKVNAKGKLEEHYPDEMLILTYKSAESASGVDRAGYYSKSLYEIAAQDKPSKPPSDNTGANPPPVTLEKPVTPPPPPAGPSYEDLTTSAWTAMLARDFTKALELLQQAINKDPKKGTAFGYRGVAYLYGFADIASAEQSSREALARNDHAIFRVLHDHSGTFQAFCYGWLYIGKSEVAFQSDEGHGFRANDSEIREAKLNSLIGAAYSAFHLKTSGDNYNLAPGTVKLPEANLILTLIRE